MAQTLEAPKVTQRDGIGRFNLSQMQDVATFPEWPTHLPKITNNAAQNAFSSAPPSVNWQWATGGIPIVLIRF